MTRPELMKAMINILIALANTSSGFDWYPSRRVIRRRIVLETQLTVMIEKGTT